MPSNDKRNSRITVACSSCRSRKQKCSGEKPVCQQCLEYNRPCEWPEQLRRGPAKGHVESLEHRLQVTEGLLLRLLPEISDTQLRAILPEKTDNGPSYAPLARLEKRGIEDWSQYPLDSFTNIRKWQQACIGHRTPDHTSDHEPVTSKNTRGPRGTKRKPPTDSEGHGPLKRPEVLPAGLKQIDHSSIQEERTISNSHEGLPEYSQIFHCGMQADSGSTATTNPKTIAQFFW